jgi:hypothetical protein
MGLVSGQGVSTRQIYHFSSGRRAGDGLRLFALLWALSIHQPALDGQVHRLASSGFRCDDRHTEKAQCVAARNGQSAGWTRGGVENGTGRTRKTTLPIMAVLATTPCIATVSGRARLSPTTAK